MTQYIWFHPLYIKESSQTVLPGQINNAQANNYTVLKENELYKVHSADHLTIVGHSVGPKTLRAREEDYDEDTGRYIQGDTAAQCVDRLVSSGLRFAPKILSLECCHAAVKNGIAPMLSIHPFFKNSLVEANTGGIGRNIRTNMTVDFYGRVVMHEEKNPWIFFLRGIAIIKQTHGTYMLNQVLENINPTDFHKRFFVDYKPGFFGGRVGRYCSTTKYEITLEQALIFANNNPHSATGKALDCLFSHGSVP